MTFNIKGIDWAIIGAETGNRKEKVIPKREWIESIVVECRKANVPVFMKSNLRDVWGDDLIQEYPW
jgi:protein gp37